MQRKRRFRSPLKALNIQIPKGNGFHAFRHANAVLMDRLSVPMKIRQQRLGHGDASITLGIYAHAVGEDSWRWRDNWDASYGGNRWKFWTQNGRKLKTA
jgi:integrase